MLADSDLAAEKYYNLQTLKDNLRLFTPEILDRINRVIVLAGHRALKKSSKEGITVPVNAFQIDQTYRRATLTVNEIKLDKAPHQAKMSDDEFQRNLEQYYGVAP